MEQWVPVDKLDKNNPEDKVIIHELRRFNWGALCLNWIWGACNGIFNEFLILCLVLEIVWLCLALFLPALATWFFAGFVSAAIYCGMNGNKWVYEKKKITDIAKFSAVQKKWAIFSVTLMLLITISFVGIVVAVGLKFASLFSPSGRGELMLKAVLESLIKQKEYSTLKSGSDVAEFLLNSQDDDSKDFTPYGPSGIQYNRTSSKGTKSSVVFTFYKEDKCSIDDKNCYVYYYESFGDAQLKPRAKAYYGDNGKIKIVKLEDEK